MVICLEEISESNREEAKEKGTMLSMANQWQKQSGSVLLQTNHSLSVTFLRDFNGVVLKLYQAPEITRNFVTFHPSGSHLNLSLGLSQSTSLPRNNYSAKMLDWNNPSKVAENRSQIIRTLREVVKRVVVEFRLSSSPLNPCGRTNLDGVTEAVPVSFRPPSTSMDMVLPRKKRVTTLLIGETLVSFELPYNCPFHPDDLDELVEVERNEMAKNNIGEIIYNLPRYTFLQRLRGWRMERRQRINGRFDMYYHHLRSRKVFRSVAEVVNFFMYEVYPDKPSTKSKLGQPQFSGFKRERKGKKVAPLKRKIEEYESKKAREKWAPLLFDINENGDNKKEDNHHRHIPMFDLNDDHQKEEEEEGEEDNYYEDQNLMCDVVGDNYNQDNETYDQKETVEKFLAESYNNLMNLPNTNNDDDDAKKSKAFSFDINEKICEEEEDDDANKQSVEEFLAEAYHNLMNYHKTQPTSQKGKEKRSSSSIEKPRRKKVKTFTPTSIPSFPNTPININSIPSIPSEKITKTVEPMEMPKSASITNVQQNHFNFKEANGENNFIFTDICESSVAAAMKANTSGSGGRGSSSAFYHMDECDLINHIPESSDMFDLAMFLAKNRGGNNAGF